MGGAAVKMSINLDCTPEEARAFLGLPDVKPMQERMMVEVENRLRKAISDSSPEAFVKTWLPLTLEGMGEFQRAVWASFSKVAGKE
jgi:hypothetical protein